MGDYGYDDMSHKFDTNFDIIKVMPPATILMKDPIWEGNNDVDWETVSVDTKVYIKDFSSSKWEPRYFAGVDESGKIRVWANGATSFSAYGSIAVDKSNIKLAEE